MSMSIHTILMYILYINSINIYTHSIAAKNICVDMHIYVYIHILIEYLLSYTTNLLESSFCK